MTFWRGVQECSAVVAPQARDYRTKAIIARARSRAAPLYTSGRPVAGILQRSQQTAAAARTFSPRGEVPRARVRLRRARIQSMPTRNACADDISHIHVADARHIFMGRTSAPWAPLRYAPRRQPTHPPSSEPAGAQGVLGRFGTWCPRLSRLVQERPYSVGNTAGDAAASAGCLRAAQWHAGGRCRYVERAP